MKNKVLSCTGLLLLGALSVASVKPARAADAPAAAAQRSAASQLSQQELDTVLTSLDGYSSMLKKAGYNTTLNTDAKGTQRLLVDWQNGPGKYALSISLDKSDQGESLTFVAPLSALTDQTKVPVVALLRLLESQDATKGWYFVFNSKDKRFFLCRMIPVGKITTRIVLNEFNNFERNIQGTEPYWNPAAWVAPKPQAGAAPAGAPAPATK